MFQLCGLINKNELSKIDKSKYYIEPKIDGCRIMAFINNGEVKLLDRQGNDKAKQFFEVAEELSQLKNSYILDGEIIVDGSFKKTMERMHEENDFKLKIKASQNKAVFFVFDILIFRGKGLSDKNLCYRKELLDEFFLNEGRYLNLSLIKKINSTVYKNNICLTEYSTQEGFVLKRIDSYNIPDDRKNWLKFKYKKTEQFKILSGIVENKNLILTTEHGRVSVPREEDKEYFFKNLPKYANVEYLEMTENLKFRQPIFKGFVC